MSFGWSAGDIVSAVSTLVKVGKALKESGGAASEYQEAVDFLTGVGKTLTGIQTILQSNPNLKWEPELIEQAEHLKSAVEKFKARIDKYDLSLGADTERKKARRIPREIQFALSDQVRALSAAISQPQIVLGVFISLQNLSSILDLSRDTKLSQEKLELYSEQISQEFPNISAAVVNLRRDMTAGIGQTSNSQLQSEGRIRDSLNEVLVHTRDVKDIQRNLAENSDASSEELQRWQAEL